MHLTVLNHQPSLRKRSTALDHPLLFARRLRGPRIASDPKPRGSDVPDHTSGSAFRGSAIGRRISGGTAGGLDVPDFGYPARREGPPSAAEVPHFPGAVPPPRFTFPGPGVEAQPRRAEPANPENQTSASEPRWSTGGRRASPKPRSPSSVKRPISSDARRADRVAAEDAPRRSMHAWCGTACRSFRAEARPSETKGRPCRKTGSPRHASCPQARTGCSERMTKAVTRGAGPGEQSQNPSRRCTTRTSTVDQSFPGAGQRLAPTPIAAVSARWLRLSSLRVGVVRLRSEEHT